MCKTSGQFIPCSAIYQYYRICMSRMMWFYPAKYFQLISDRFCLMDYCQQKCPISQLTKIFLSSIWHDITCNSIPGSTPHFSHSRWWKLGVWEAGNEAMSTLVQQQNKQLNHLKIFPVNIHSPTIVPDISPVYTRFLVGVQLLPGLWTFQLRFHRRMYKISCELRPSLDSGLLPRTVLLVNHGFSIILLHCPSSLSFLRASFLAWIAISTEGSATARLGVRNFEIHRISHGFQISDWISVFHVDFWISKWISGFSKRISGFQSGFWILFEKLILKILLMNNDVFSARCTQNTMSQALHRFTATQRVLHA